MHNELIYEDDDGRMVSFEQKRGQNKKCHGCKHYELDKHFPERCVGCVRMMGKTELRDLYE